MERPRPVNLESPPAAFRPKSDLAEIAISRLDRGRDAEYNSEASLGMRTSFVAGWMR